MRSCNFAHGECILVAADENHYGLSCPSRGRADAFGGGADLWGVRRDSPHRDCEVAASDKQGIDAVNTSNGIYLLQSLRVFDLRHHRAHGVRKFDMLVQRKGAIPPGARGVGKSALAAPVAAGCRHLPCLFLARHVRDEHADCAAIKHRK